MELIILVLLLTLIIIKAITGLAIRIIIKLGACLLALVLIAASIYYYLNGMLDWFISQPIIWFLTAIDVLAFM